MFPGSGWLWFYWLCSFGWLNLIIIIDHYHLMYSYICNTGHRPAEYKIALFKILKSTVTFFLFCISVKMTLNSDVSKKICDKIDRYVCSMLRAVKSIGKRSSVIYFQHTATTNWQIFARFIFFFTQIILFGFFSYNY